MLILAVNKQLDLQSALAATGRCIAQFQGWYRARRDVQHHVIEVLLVAIVAGLRLVRRNPNA
ncbi:MAG: isopropylmalate isomerase large subunit [Cypionkella sp.]|nr:isopropylmalate isomerase large subunit [Cypionkella sp.]